MTVEFKIICSNLCRLQDLISQVRSGRIKLDDKRAEITSQIEKIMKFTDMTEGSKDLFGRLLAEWQDVLGDIEPLAQQVLGITAKSPQEDCGGGSTEVAVEKEEDSMPFANIFSSFSATCERVGIKQAVRLPPGSIRYRLVEDLNRVGRKVSASPDVNLFQQVLEGTFYSAECSLVTTNLVTCSAIAIHSKGKNFVAHINGYVDVLLLESAMRSFLKDSDLASINLVCWKGGCKEYGEDKTDFDDVNKDSKNTSQLILEKVIKKVLLWSDEQISACFQGVVPPHYIVGMNQSGEPINIECPYISFDKVGTSIPIFIESDI